MQMLSSSAPFAYITVHQMLIGKQPVSAAPATASAACCGPFPQPLSRFISNKHHLKSTSIIRPNIMNIPSTYLSLHPMLTFSL